MTKQQAWLVSIDGLTYRGVLSPSPIDGSNESYLVVEELQHDALGKESWRRVTLTEQRIDRILLGLSRQMLGR